MALSQLRVLIVLDGDDLHRPVIFIQRDADEIGGILGAELFHDVRALPEKNES